MRPVVTVVTVITVITGVTLATAVLVGTGCSGARDAAAGAQRVQTRLNPAPPARRVVSGLESVCAAGTIVWIVPARDGVVLIDAGFDETGAAIKKALAGRRVLAVLLTHGHLDHRSAAHLFNAPVYVGRADVGLVDGTKNPSAPFAKVAGVVGVPQTPRVLLPVDDGQVLAIGGRTFFAVGLPGHTPGSTGFQLGQVLFTGDAMQGPLGDGELWPAPPIVTDDMRAAYQSMRKLARLDVETVLDGHFGRTDHARAAARRAVTRVHDDENLYEHPILRPAGCAENDDAAVAPVPVVAAPAAAPAKAKQRARR